MTEAEWLETNRPMAMLRHLQDAADAQRYPDRKFRLFACACANELLSGLSDHRTWQAGDHGYTLRRGPGGPAPPGECAAGRAGRGDPSWQDFQSGNGREDD